MTVSIVFLCIGIAAIAFFLWVLRGVQSQLRQEQRATPSLAPIHVVRIPGAHVMMRGPALVYSNPLAQPSRRQPVDSAWLHAKAGRPA